MALVLVTLALFLTLHLTSIQPRTMKRLRAHEAALRSLESVMETVRGGSIPLIEGRSRWVGSDEGSLDGTAARAQLTIDVVADSEVDDLYSVTIEARYSIAGRVHVRRLKSLVWRPS